MDLEIKPTAGKNLTPSLPKEPPKELKEMTFTTPPMEMMGEAQGTLKIDGTEVKTDPAPVTEQKVEPKTEEKVEAPKKEVKTEPTSVIKPPKEEKKVDTKVAPTEKVAEQKTTSSLITPPGKKKEETDTFDYSKYTPQEVTNLKNMSRQSREYVAKMIDENKQLASLKDSTYLQHEAAYTLNPDYQTLQVKTYRAQIEGQAWEQALLDIKAGKDYQEITGFNNQGQPIFQTRKPTDRDEIRVNNNLSACINATRQFNNELQQFPNQFKQRIQQDQQAIQQYEKEHFAWVAQPELLEHTIEVEGVGDRKIKDIISDVKNMFPIYDRSSTGARIAAHLAVGLMIRNAELKEARNGKQIENIVSQEEQHIEPSSDNRDTGKSSANGNIPKDFQLPAGIAEGLGIR
jgi:hypothetical protein